MDREARPINGSDIMKEKGSPLYLQLHTDRYTHFHLFFQLCLQILQNNKLQHYTVGENKNMVKDTQVKQKKLKGVKN